MRNDRMQLFENGNYSNGAVWMNAASAPCILISPTCACRPYRRVAQPDLRRGAAPSFSPGRRQRVGQGARRPALQPPAGHCDSRGVRLEASARCSNASAIAPGGITKSEFTEYGKGRRQYIRARSSPIPPCGHLNLFRILAGSPSSQSPPTCRNAPAATLVRKCAGRPT